MFNKVISFFNGVFNDINSYDSYASTKKYNDETSSVFDGDATNNQNNVNGELDEAIYQGEYGDCWLLSALLSMSYTESGAEVIKESIDLNDDGSVDLYFDGVEKGYNISSSELEQENKPTGEKSNYSRGDDDALAIELGVEKLVADPSVKTEYSIQNGGNPYYVYQLYGADKISIASTEEEISDAFEYFEDNSNECSMTLGVVNESVCGLKENHGYAVKDINDNSVVIVDPWNSEKEISVEKDNLLKNSKNLSVVYAEFATE